MHILSGSMFDLLFPHEGSWFSGQSQHHLDWLLWCLQCPHVILYTLLRPPQDAMLSVFISPARMWVIPFYSAAPGTVAQTAERLGQTLLMMIVCVFNEWSDACHFCSIITAFLNIAQTVHAKGWSRKVSGFTVYTLRCVKSRPHRDSASQHAAGQSLYGRDEMNHLLGTIKQPLEFDWQLWHLASGRRLTVVMGKTPGGFWDGELRPHCSVLCVYRTQESLLRTSRPQRWHRWLP